MLLLVRCLATVAREVTLKAAWPLWAPCSYVPTGPCVLVYSLCSDFIAKQPHLSQNCPLVDLMTSLPTLSTHSPASLLPGPSQTLSTQFIQTWLKGFKNLKKKKTIYFISFFILGVKYSRVWTHVLKHLHVWFTAGSHPMLQVGMELTILVWAALELKTVQLQPPECESYRHKPPHLAYLCIFNLTVFRPWARLLCSQTCVICIIITWPYPISASPPEPQHVSTTILHPPPCWWWSREARQSTK